MGQGAAGACPLSRVLSKKVDAVAADLKGAGGQDLRGVSQQVTNVPSGFPKYLYDGPR